MRICSGVHQRPATHGNLAGTDRIPSGGNCVAPGRLQELGAQHRVRILPGALTLALASQATPRVSWSTTFFGLWTLEELFRGNGVICRTQRVIQGDDNGHVGRHCEVSLAPPCPELCCELRGFRRHSYPGPRTCGRSEKPTSSGWRGLNPGFQRNLSPP